MVTYISTGSESGTTNMPMEKAEPKKRILKPLFQVAYDRTLCKPLGTVSDFSKLNLKAKDKLVEIPADSGLLSRSPSPLDINFEDTLPKSSTNVTVKYQLPIKVAKPKAIKRDPDIKQNVLIVFEFSSVYPFVYSNNKFKCFVCSQPYHETALLRRHMADTHTFTSIRRLINNRRENILKVDVSTITCKLCPVIPKDLYDLKIHLKEVHNKTIDPDLRDNMIPFNLDKEGPYQCVVCKENFIKIRILVIHMSSHYNNYSCEICGSGFLTLRLLKTHLAVHENGSFPCDKCDKVFATSLKRSLHIRGVHLKQCPRRCLFCPERFNSSYQRALHLQNVHNQTTRVHKCETCGRGFALKYHLKSHVKSVHLQERNSQCDICLQRFCNKETLKRHLVIHTGEKKHKCDICGMAFLRRKNLKDHLRLHDAVV